MNRNIRIHDKNLPQALKERTVRLLQTLDTLQKEKECWCQIESHARTLLEQTEGLSPEQQEINKQETEKMLAVCAEQFARINRLIKLCEYDLEKIPLADES